MGYLSCIGEGNGNPLQCSCLENPRDRESGGLPSMGLHRVGHDWSTLAAAADCESFSHFLVNWWLIGITVVEQIYNWVPTVEKTSIKLILRSKIENFTQKPGKHTLTEIFTNNTSPFGLWTMFLAYFTVCVCASCWVVADSLWPHGL